MAKKLKTDPITKNDLQNYVNTQSGFAFEMETLQALKDKGFDCEHGATYIDRVTKKHRQFDQSRVDDEQHRCSNHREPEAQRRLYG